MYGRQSVLSGLLQAQYNAISEANLLQVTHTRPERQLPVITVSLKVPGSTLQKKSGSRGRQLII